METTPPEMEETTIETYRDGVLVESRHLAVPKAPPSPAELQQRIAGLEQRLREAQQQEPDESPVEEVP